MPIRNDVQFCTSNSIISHAQVQLPNLDCSTYARMTPKRPLPECKQHKRQQQWHQFGRLELVSTAYHRNKNASMPTHAMAHVKSLTAFHTGDTWPYVQLFQPTSEPIVFCLPAGLPSGQHGAQNHNQHPHYPWQVMPFSSAGYCPATKEKYQLWRGSTANASNLRTRSFWWTNVAEIFLFLDGYVKQGH